MAYVNWLIRRIPRKPRTVHYWPMGVTPLQLCLARENLRPFLQKVEAGDDLTPHLSTLVKTTGLVLPNASSEKYGKDIDSILNRQGLHHFHVGISTENNKRGRSRQLVFAEVLETTFNIVAISDHDAFKPGSSEQKRFFEICNSYIAKDIPSGQGFMLNPVSPSGRSMMIQIFADVCADQIDKLDDCLNEPAFIDKLYNDPLIMSGGQSISRPLRPSFVWRFNDLQFGIFEKKTNVFFCLQSFGSR